ncbi:hypothetical protein LTR84_009896 [Exophiala bonariae]|uniref:Heme oxygenase-like protein n=1 Tax=Exophiala bonariae TaxID=1690606 RepID=A0AAV9NL63_9EURO|nr:hypothetical protein LTR84_009896 [Exophiala bonariae]
MVPQPVCESETPRSLLPIELLAATRDKHHALNLQILKNLPLCVPPASDSPILYAKGMAVFGQIYYAFEAHLTACLEDKEFDETLRDLYKRIYVPRLLRSPRLRRDLEIVNMRLGDHGKQEVEDISERSMIYYRRIRAALCAKPHVLLAYMWTMYLALFNGGRWMRSQFFSAGSSFWLGQDFPLSFWDFEDPTGTASNGEDLKVAFKENFAEASRLLDDTQRDEVIDESKNLFDLCLEMVRFLEGGPSLLASPETFSTHIAATNRAADRSPTTGSLVLPAWHYVASLFGSLATAASNTVWRRKELSSD